MLRLKNMIRENHGSRVQDVHVSTTHSNLLVTCAARGQVNLYDTDHCEGNMDLMSHYQYSCAAGCGSGSGGPDGFQVVRFVSRCILAAAGCTVHVINISDSRVVAMYDLCDHVVDMQPTEDLHQVAVLLANGTVQMWCIEQHRMLREWSVGRDDVRCAAVVAGREVLVATGSGEVIWGDCVLYRRDSGSIDHLKAVVAGDVNMVVAATSNRHVVVLGVSTGHLKMSVLSEHKLRHRVQCFDVVAAAAAHCGQPVLRLCCVVHDTVHLFQLHPKRSGVTRICTLSQDGVRRSQPLRTVAFIRNRKHRGYDVVAAGEGATVWRWCQQQRDSTMSVEMTAHNDNE